MHPKIDALKELVVQNQLENALEQLHAIFSLTDSELDLDAQLLISDYRRLQSDIRRNKGSEEERSLSRNKLTSNTLSLIQELEANPAPLEAFLEREKTFNSVSMLRNRKPISKEESELLFRRMTRLKARKLNFKALWIDDEPDFQKNEHQQIEQIGIDVHIAANETEAKGLMRNMTYQLVISDIERSGRDKNGIEFMNELRAEGLAVPFIFYITNFDPLRGTPPHAFGITNSVAEFFHLVMDVVERVG